MNIYILKLVHAKKCLFDKLVRAFEDEILNTTETMVKYLSYSTLIDDKKVTF